MPHQVFQIPLGGKKGEKGCFEEGNYLLRELWATEIIKMWSLPS